MATEKERQEFIVLFCADFAGKVIADKKHPEKSHAFSTSECLTAARALLRHARTHRRLAVDECNGAYYQLTGGHGDAPSAERIEAWESRLTRDTERVEKRIREICAGFNLPVTLGGDPRGYTVKIKLPSGAYNTWGGSKEGYGVPQ